MPATYTQAGRPLAVTTPLAPDTLLLVGFNGSESISQLFQYQLNLLAPRDKEVAFDKLLGQKITVKMALVKQKDEAQPKYRYFNGICKSVFQGETDNEFTEYRLEIVPQVWLLTRKAQSRIFQHVSVSDILKKVFQGFDVVYQLQGTFQPRDFCVQYRETDFHFASRLMEEEGIFYFFKHTDKGHQMVVANSPQSHPDLPERSKLLFRDPSQAAVEGQDLISDWSKTQELTAGKYLLWDHCFELPHKHLEAEKGIADSVTVGQVAHKLKVADNSKLELYDWPGEYAQRFDGVNKGGGEQPAEIQKIFEDNKRTVEIRMQQEALNSIVAHGASNCSQVCSGHKFTLATVPADAMTKPIKAEGAYVVTEASHSAHYDGYRSSSATWNYSNHFACIPQALPYRPHRTTPKPVVPGTQSAVVVGPPGEEIFTDKYGRVKVQFHWDRDCKNNADSSCWIRVGTVWAGKQWGMMHIPRVGQEVLVDFLEGDPDQPVIVGSVFNADQMPAYKLPDEKTKSYLKTNTSPGGVGFNELRFEDKKGKEQIFIHGERNLDLRVKHDAMERVIHDRHLIVGWEKDGQKGGDQREMVYQDKHHNVHRNQVEQVQGNLQVTVGKGEAKDGGNVDVVIEKDKKELVEKNSHLHVKENNIITVDKALATTAGSMQTTVGKDQSLHVKGLQKTKVDGAQSLTVGGDCNEKIGGGHSVDVGTNLNQKVGQNLAVESGQVIHLKGGMTVVIEAGTKLSLKVGGNFIDISPAGIAIQGTMVLINSGGAAGSGPGAQVQSPQPPDEPEAAQDAQVAKPTKPTVADDAKTGHKSAP